MTKRLLCLTKTTLCPFIQLWHLAFLRHCSLSLPWKWLSCQFCEKVSFFPFCFFVSIIQLYFSRKFYHWVGIGNVEDRHRLFIWCSCQCQSGWNCQIHYWKIAASLFRRLQTGFWPNWMWDFRTAQLCNRVHMPWKWSVISKQGT